MLSVDKVTLNLLSSIKDVKFIFKYIEPCLAGQLVVLNKILVVIYVVLFLFIISFPCPIVKNSYPMILFDCVGTVCKLVKKPCHLSI